MDQVNVETSRHVRLAYEPASLAHRMLAWATDALLYGIYITVFLWLWSGVVPTQLTNDMDLSWVAMLLISLPYFIYFPLSETIWDGRTVGKKLLGIRVTKLDGSRASPGDFTIRWLFRFIEISGTGGVLAILTILINGKGQRLGDLAAKTSVIIENIPSVSYQNLFKDTDTSRPVVFSSAAELQDSDIRIIRKLLNSRRDYSPKARQKLMDRSRKLVEEKTGAVNRSMNSEQYLTTVVKDYNTIYGSDLNRN